MSLDPQSLWQDQPTDDLAVHPERSRGGGVDYAVPTTQFGKPPPRRAGFFGVLSAAAALAAVLVVSVGIALRPPSLAPAQRASQEPIDPRGASSPIDELELLLAECRTFASPEAGPPPDWDRAASACSRALDLEPLHHEAAALLARIGLLRGCETNLSDAASLAAAGRPESALRALEKLTPPCELYYVQALPLARTTVREVQAQAATDCRSYASAKKWVRALDRCALYNRLACQSGDVSADPLHRTMLEARAKMEPGAPAWECPRIDVFRPPAAPPDPSGLVRNRLAKRYPEPALGHALVSYADGDYGEARVTLQKVIETMAKADWHQTARALLLDLNEATALAAKGNTFVQTGKLEQAANAFRQAFELDARLMLGEFKGDAAERARELDRGRSYLRKTAIDLMSQSTYERGRDLADRRDFRAACLVWKVGNSFSRSNIDLLKALTNVCTKRASEAFDRADSCEQLRAARDFAVDGDGFEQRIEEALGADGCR